MKKFIYISYILTILVGTTYNISFAQDTGSLPPPPRAGEFCTGQKCDPLPPPPSGVKGMIFRFLGPKKNNIYKAIDQVEKLLPRLEKKGIDTNPIKNNIKIIKVDHQCSEQLMMLGMVTKNKDIKKEIGNKVFVMHTDIVNKFKDIKLYISTQMGPKNNDDEKDKKDNTGNKKN